MKKQLEFDNKALVKRWDDAKEQYKRSQESIADLTDKVRALGGSSVPSTPAALENGGLATELMEHDQNDQRLQIQLSEQREELQRLRSAKGELEGALNQARQMLDDVREGHEEREKTHLTTYEELLRLQSSLAAIQQGQHFQEYVRPFGFLIPQLMNIFSTMSYRSLSDKLEEEQSLRGKLDIKMRRVRKELEESQQDCKTSEVLYWRVSEQHTDHLPVTLVDKDKRIALEEVKKRQSSELINLQQENKFLRTRLLHVETDLTGQRKLLQNEIHFKNSLVNHADKDEILKTIESIKDAVTNRPAKSMEDFERNIAALEEKVMRSNAALARSEEVFTNSKKPSQASTVKSTLLSQPQSSSKQQSTKPNRQSFASRFSKAFTTGKADTKPSIIAPPESERRNARTAKLATESDPWRSPQPASTARSHYSNEDFQ